MTLLNEWKKVYPEKFIPEDEIFSHIRRGAVSRGIF